MVKNNVNITRQICEVLNLPPTTTEFKIVFTPDCLVEAHVTMYIIDEELGGVKEILSKYELVEKDESI